MSAGLRLHADLTEYIHRLRDRETARIFGRCPPKLFPRALEVGSGYGHQARALQRYAAHLTCSDFSAQWFGLPEHAGLTFRTCDAEQVDETFPARHFDLIFSSNVFEHLASPERALQGMHRTLADDGLLIHVMPSRLWACSRVVLYLPHRASRVLETLTAEGLGGVAARVRGGAVTAGEGWDNNPKTAPPVRSRLARLLLPAPHGVSSTLRAEVAAFGRARWMALFRRCEFDVLAVLDGPAAWGYGFELNPLRGVCERLGLVSEYIYIAVKRGFRSPYAAHFVPSP